MDVEVDRAQLERWRTMAPTPRDLTEGEVRLRVDRFGFSSNNVTYAVIGDMLRYWEFFPASPADAGDATTWGRVPVWGFADVVETRSPDVVEGERLFGFLPMSTGLVILAGRADDTTVSDVSPHRADLAGPYNSLRRCAADPAWRPDREELQMLLYPLFFTSYLIDDFLADQDDLGATQVVVTSASAKTSLGLAHRLHARGRRVVGLTSAGNAGFCRSLGVYDEVLAYDDVDDVPHVPSVLVDVAGNQDVVRAVHTRLGDALACSLVVGDTHWDHAATAGTAELPGPRPTFFFAPSQVSKRTKEWGAEELDRRLAAGWGTYADWVAGWLTLEHAAGADAVIEVFRTYLSGRVDPGVGTICTLATEEVPA
jgi:hypothetical protein